MGFNSKPIHPLRRLREKYNLTQGEMGALLDQSGNFISQIEAGFSDIPQKTITDICKCFEIKPTELKSELGDYKVEQKKQLLEQVEAGN